MDEHPPRFSAPLCLLGWLSAGLAFSAAAGPPPIVDIRVDSLDGSNGFVIQGGRTTFGRLVSGGRDLNGDGVPDILVANPSTSESQTQVNVIYGGGVYGASFDAGSVSVNEGKILRTASEGLRSVDMQGDFNGDGIADLYLNLRDERYIALGGPALITGLFQLNSSNGVVLVPGTEPRFASDENPGFIGDFNGDGVDDLGLRSRGILFGSTALPSQIDVNNIAGEIGVPLLNSPYYRVGDINGDGFDDAARPSGETTTFYYGNSGPFANVTVAGPAFSVNIGSTARRTIAAIGDVNGDGIDDVAIGQPVDPNNLFDQTGRVAVIFGQPERYEGVMDVNTLDGTTGFVLTTSGANDRLGQSVAPAGDFNADGIDDFLVGSPGFVFDPNADRGVVWLIYGRSTAFPSVIAVSDLNGESGHRIVSETIQDTPDFERSITVGWSVSTAGDINRDGVDDIILGGQGLEVAGRAYVVFGSPPDGINLSSAIDNGRNTIASGDSVVYSISVDNVGTEAVSAAQVSVALDAGSTAALTDVSWTCSGTGGGTCADSAGSGSITQNVSLPIGGVVTYEYAGVVAGEPGQFLTVTAEVTTTGGDVSPIDNVSSDTDPLGVAISDFSTAFPGFCAGTVPPPPDRYEINDSLGVATPITAQINEPFESGGILDSQFHTFHSDMDEDWLRFNAYVKTDPNTDEPVIYRLLFKVNNRFDSGLAMKELEKRGTGLLVQYFDENGTQLIPTELDDRFNRYIDTGLYEPAFTGRCFGPVAGEPVVEANRGINGIIPATDGVIYARILQCRNAGLDVDSNSRSDETEYCIPGDDTEYEVLVTESLTTQVGVLSGTIVDAVSGEPVRNAFVSSADFLVPTRESGLFTAASLETNDATATIIAEGYEELTLRYNIAQEFTTECGVVSLQRAHVAGAPDLSTAAPSVSPATAQSGGSIELTAVVRNAGNNAAPASTLTFHASNDPNIDESDALLGTVSIPPLAPLSEVNLMVSGVAPDYGPTAVLYTGACAQAVDGESNLTNNCFGFAALVELSEGVFVDGFESAPMTGAQKAAGFESQELGSPPQLSCTVE